MKYICLDVETTGVHTKFDRIIEIGCIDITNGISNKKIYQQYINPKRSVPEEAVKIHGITNEFLVNYQPFSEYAQSFLDFINDATLIIHNANFDMRFLNAELERNNFLPLNNSVIDTLKLAKEKFPGKKASLDALKEKFNINIERTFHGALLDSEILAYVYLELIKIQEKLNINVEEENITSFVPSNKKLFLTEEENQKNCEFFKKYNKNE